MTAVPTTPITTIPCLASLAGSGRVCPEWVESPGSECRQGCLPTLQGIIGALRMPKGARPTPNSA